MIATIQTGIVGADVGHPGPGVTKPSVTGLVFSYDEVATQYAILTEIQQPRVIESLQKMMVWALIPVSIDVQHMDLRFLRFETCAPHFFFSFLFFSFLLFFLSYYIKKNPTDKLGPP